jgi:MFS family permease
MPFLLPLLYQVGLGYSPIESGLLIMPQPLAAICFRYWMPQMITYLGYRKLLLYNTIAIGVCIMVFATVGHGTPVWIIVLQAAAFGFFSSLQYTSMNTLAYADVDGRNTSMASTILSTIQQLSMSFGVATSSLVTALFITDRFHASTEEMIHGMHNGFLVLGAVTILSAIGFAELKHDDGDNVSLHKMPHS